MNHSPLGYNQRWNRPGLYELQPKGECSWYGNDGFFARSSPEMYRTRVTNTMYPKGEYLVYANASFYVRLSIETISSYNVIIYKQGEHTFGAIELYIWYDNMTLIGNCKDDTGYFQMKALYAWSRTSQNMTEIGQLLAEILQLNIWNSKLWFLGQKLCHTGPLIGSNLWHHTG